MRPWAARKSLGPDFCPFHTALATGQGTSSTLRSQDNRYFQVQAAPVRELEGPARHLIITVRDVTHEVQQQQKLAAIHQAGMELADLTPEEVFHMPIRDRIELLKSNIIHFTKDLLHFEVAEIRLLDRKTNRLEPLLAVAMDPDAAMRDLFALPQGNGVTGFVAATGKSYLCEDTTEDPLFLEGVRGAKSSLTVPLLLHDEVIGTFNVESMESRAFSESDLQFLEIFSRDVAAALNTLELLVAEKANTAAESVEAIHSAVALPIDEILNEAVNVMERYIGHEPEVVERLQRILRNARDIKQVIQKVGQTMSPGQAHPVAMQVEDRPLLRDRRVLVVDADGNVRSAAHALLDRYAVTVETAHDGAEALCMVRAMSDTPYDVIIADIRLPDMNGYELMLKLQEVVDPVPLVLMTGFGYDPGPFDRQRPQGGPAGLGHSLQAVPLGPASQCRGTHHSRAASGAADVIAAVVLLLVAAVGHAAIWVAVINRTHASGWPHALVQGHRQAASSCFSSCLPLAVAWLARGDRSRVAHALAGVVAASPAVHRGHLALEGYLALCWLAPRQLSCDACAGRSCDDVSSDPPLPPQPQPGHRPHPALARSSAPRHRPSAGQREPGTWTSPSAAWTCPACRRPWKDCRSCISPTFTSRAKSASRSSKRSCG